MKKSLLVILFFALSATLSFAQDSTAYKASIAKMMEVSGGHALYKAAITQMISYSRQEKTNVPDKFWDDLTVEMSKISITELTDMLVPVYKKYLTQSDINQLIKFYESPIGKKFAEKSPQIMQESMQVGQQWGQKLGQQITDKLKAQGY